MSEQSLKSETWEKEYWERMEEVTQFIYYQMAAVLKSRKEQYIRFGSSLYLPVQRTRIVGVLYSPFTANFLTEDVNGKQDTLTADHLELRNLILLATHLEKKNFTVQSLG